MEEAATLNYGWRPSVAFVAAMPDGGHVAAVGELVAKMAVALRLEPSAAWFGFLVGEGEPAKTREAVRWQVIGMRPRFILAMGDFAVKVFGADGPGRWAEFDGVPVLGTFHPAEILGSSQLKAPAWEHLKALGRRLHG